MTFGSAYCTLRREGTVVAGGDILEGDDSSNEKVGKVRGGFVVE